MSDPQNTIKGTAASETLIGSSQNDRIISSGGSDIIYGYDGDDQLNGYPTQNGYSHWDSSDPLKIFGGEGNDFIVGGSERDQLYGGLGDDSIHGRAGDDTLFGEGGNDQILGKEGNDLLDGGDGADSLFGGEGDDLLKGSLGADELWGSDGDDELYGGPGDDYLDGGLGDDYLSGNDGDDELYGDIEDSSTFGNDTLLGGSGADYLSGDAGDDVLDGGADNDTLFGGSGNDILDGGTGFDRLYGGDGDDKYILNSSTFELVDSDGNDSATVNIDFSKIPSTIETINYAEGVKALPYWINALLFDDAARYSNLLGAGKTFYYGFPRSIEDYSYSIDEKGVNGWQPFSNEQQRDTREIFKYIESIIDVQFVETNDFNQKNTLAFANSQQDSGAFAIGPGAPPNASDIYIGILNDGSFQVPFKNGYRYANVFTHEIGHALGLKHPFNDPSPSGKIATPPYLLGDENNATWTQMSYTGDKNSYEYSPLDIAALQYLYGVKSASRSGNDVYIFKENEPNFIWDGSGDDTIDASSSSMPVTIFLNPGYQGFKGLTKKYAPITSSGQITVNFGTDIENIIGSSFSDVLTGNNLKNTLVGGDGSDVIDGGDEIDTAIYTEDRKDSSLTSFIDYGTAGDSIKISSAWIIESGGNTDTLRNIERLKFKETNVALDLDGNAGKAVKLLSVLLGAENSQNKGYIGAGLSALDNGMSYESLMQAGLDFVLGENPSSSAVVDLFYKNLTGEPTPDSILKEYSELLDSGLMTSSSLGIAVADHSLNISNIDLVGLAQTGVEYII